MRGAAAGGPATVVMSGRRSRTERRRLTAASEEFTCAQFVELVSDYVDGALEPADHQRFEDHLAQCGGCTAYFEQLRATIALTGRLRESDVPAEAVDALLSAFRDYAR